MREFFKGFIKGISYVVLTYCFAVLVLNSFMWFLTDETVEVYKPVLNLLELR